MKRTDADDELKRVRNAAEQRAAEEQARIEAEKVAKRRQTCAEQAQSKAEAKKKLVKKRSAKQERKQQRATANGAKRPDMGADKLVDNRKRPKAIVSSPALAKSNSPAPKRQESST